MTDLYQSQRAMRQMRRQAMQRGVMAVLILGPAIVILGGPHRLLSPLWPLHLARAALFASGFSLFYAAFPFMGLAEVSTIFFAAPLMIAVLASVGLLLLVIYVPFFNGIFDTVPLTLSEWVLLLPLIFLPSIAAELTKLIMQLLNTRRPAEAAA